MARDKRKRPNSSMNKKQLSHHRREQLQLRWIWISLGAIVVAIIAILTTGLVSHNTRTVAVVNGEPVRVSDYQKRVRYYYYSLGPNVFQDSDGQPSNETYKLVADQLVEETLVRQEARKRNLSATGDEIQVELEKTWFQHGRDPQTPTPSPTVDPSATPTPEGTPPLPTLTPDTPETFQANYEQFIDNVLKPAGLDESYVRHMAEVNVLREKLQQAVVTDVPTEEEQIHFRYAGAADAEDATRMIAEFQAGSREEVHARHILVDTAEEAEAVLARLQNGEDFGTLAAELSTDTSNKDQGGDLGWFGRGEMVSEFETVAFDSPLGLYPEPVETQFGFHVIDILGREERPIDLDTDMFDVGWYGRSQMATQFGALFAEMLFGADLGLFSEPVPTSYGVAVVDILDRQMRTLDETEQASRRQDMFQEWLDQVKQEGSIEDQWDPSMIPTQI